MSSRGALPGDPDPSVPVPPNDATIARRFLMLALGFGLSLAFVNPPFAVNDEDVHLCRIYELSQGRWLTRSDDEGEYHIVPTDYVELGNEYERVWQRRGGRVRPRHVWQQLVAPKSTILVRRTARAGGYPPVLYAPHIPIIWLLRKFDLSPLVHLYAVRVLSLFVYISLAYAAVRASARPLRWQLVICALTPMALTQAAAVSGDGVVIGLSLLCLALVGKGTCSNAPMRGREIAAMVASLAMLTLCKPVYVVIVIAWLALPWPGLKRPLYRWLIPAAAAAIAILTYLTWTHINRDLKGGPVSIYDAGQQLALLREAPWRAFSVLGRTLFERGDELMIESVLVRNKLSSGIRFVGAAAFLIHTQLGIATAWGSAVSAFAGDTLRRRLASLWFFLASLAVVLAIPSAFYICCTRVGAPALRVLQGRYFIPAVPPLLIALSFLGRPRFARWLRQRHGNRIWGVLCFTNALCLMCLIGWHYFAPNVRWPF